MRSIVFAGTLLVVASPLCHAPAAPVEPGPCQGKTTKVAAWIANSPPPKYPDGLKAAGVDGAVEVTFIVDSLGMADTASFRVLKSNHQLFTDAVRAALPGMRYRPAMIGNTPVCQWVKQAFVFDVRNSE
jgi:protein TonB